MLRQIFLSLHAVDRFFSIHLSFTLKSSEDAYIFRNKIFQEEIKSKYLILLEPIIALNDIGFF